MKRLVPVRGGVVLCAVLAAACGDGAGTNGGDDGRTGGTSAQGAAPGAGATAGGRVGVAGGSSGGSSNGGTEPVNGGGSGGVNEGGSGGAITGGGAGSGSVDPEPVEPDMTGLVPTSDRWVLFTEDAPYSRDVVFLDVATGTRHQTNPGGPQLAVASLSPDERTFFFSTGTGGADAERLIRLDATGFVPSRPITGLDGVAGAYRVLSWSGDSRYAAMSRGAVGSNSFELIDTRLLTRLATEDMSGIEAGFAPAGYHYYYYGVNPPPHPPKVARVTGTGTSSPAELPADAERLAFDPAGARLFYATGALNARSLHAIDLAGGSRVDLAVTTPGESFDGQYMPASGGSVVARVTKAERTEAELRRVFVDGVTPSVQVSNPAFGYPVWSGSLDGELLIASDGADGLELVRVEPLLRRPLPGRSDPSVVPFGFVHRHAYFPGDGRLHVATLDDSGNLVEAAVSEPGETVHVCAGLREQGPKTRLAFLARDRQELVLVDLTANPPTVARRYPRTGTDTTLGCPVWGDAGRAAAFVERGPSGNALHVVGWTSLSPGDPVLAVESTLPLDAYAVMFR